MLSDLVLDTNILMHASDPRVPTTFTSAAHLVNNLLDSSIVVCVEQGFTPSLATNRSMIMHEYLAILCAGSLGLHLIQTLASNNRIKGVPRNVGPREAKKINQAVIDKTDRIFVEVTLNSRDHVLVSHDFKAFTEPVRSTLKQQIRVTIIDCAKCLPLLP